MARGRFLAAAVAGLAMVGAVAAGGAGNAGLRVKASPAVAPCVAASLAEFRRATGRSASLEIGELGLPASAAGADVVVAADQELHRIIESGTSDPDLDIDVATIPWVLVAAPGAPTAEVASLGRSDAVVRTLPGVVAREAWRNLERQGFSPGRVETLRGARAGVSLDPGELGILPLSLAGAGRITKLDVPPLTVRALGVRASAEATASRRFLDFLGSDAGRAAFAACGRNDAR